VFPVADGERRGDPEIESCLSVDPKRESKRSRYLIKSTDQKSI
jgi:hypothetical protein